MNPDEPLTGPQLKILADAWILEAFDWLEAGDRDAAARAAHWAESYASTLESQEGKVLFLDIAELRHRSGDLDGALDLLGQLVGDPANGIARWPQVLAEVSARGAMMAAEAGRFDLASSWAERATSEMARASHFDTSWVDRLVSEFDAAGADSSVVDAAILRSARQVRGQGSPVLDVDRLRDLGDEEDGLADDLRSGSVAGLEVMEARHGLRLCAQGAGPSVGLDAAELWAAVDRDDVWDLDPQTISKVAQLARRLGVLDVEQSAEQSTNPWRGLCLSGMATASATDERSARAWGRMAADWRRVVSVLHDEDPACGDEIWAGAVLGALSPGPAGPVVDEVLSMAGSVGLLEPALSSALGAVLCSPEARRVLPERMASLASDEGLRRLVEPSASSRQAADVLRAELGGRIERTSVGEVESVLERLAHAARPLPPELEGEDQELVERSYRAGYAVARAWCSHERLAQPDLPVEEAEVLKRRALAEWTTAVMDSAEGWAADGLQLLHHLRPEVRVDVDHARDLLEVAATDPLRVEDGMEGYAIACRAVAKLIDDEHGPDAAQEVAGLPLRAAVQRLDEILVGRAGTEVPTSVRRALTDAVLALGHRGFAGDAAELAERCVVAMRTAGAPAEEAEHFRSFAEAPDLVAGEVDDSDIVNASELLARYGMSGRAKFLAELAREQGLASFPEPALQVRLRRRSWQRGGAGDAEIRAFLDELAPGPDAGEVDMDEAGPHGGARPSDDELDELPGDREPPGGSSCALDWRAADDDASPEVEGPGDGLDGGSLL